VCLIRALIYHQGGAVDDLSRGDLLGYQGIEYRHLTQEETSAHVDYTVILLI
jgi:hypothetical protein